MPVPMMQVWVVRVPVNQADVPVPMTVRAPPKKRVSQTMIVPVMLVVTMPMLMLHWLVKVVVLVSLGQVQPEA